MFGWIFFLLFDVLEKKFLVNKEVLRVIDNELASSDRYTGQKTSVPMRDYIKWKKMKKTNRKKIFWFFY